MTRLTNEISVLKFVRADRSSEFDGLLAQILAREPSRARGSYLSPISSKPASSYRIKTSHFCGY
jgi:hypothetical protein